MTEGQEEFLKILRAHRHTIDICEACAATTRDLAAEVVRGGLPRRADLEQTVAEAERVLADMAQLRQELDRVLTELVEG
jgi:sulfur relay (sulfurtransferase) complex TusBCD TusD component (DsrE family)